MARLPMSMSVPIRVSSTSISTNHRNCMHALWQRFLLSSAITRPPLPGKEMALMRTPQDRRLFRSKAAHDKMLINPRHPCTSRLPVRNHKYRINTRSIDPLRSLFRSAIKCTSSGPFRLVILLEYLSNDQSQQLWFAKQKARLGKTDCLHDFSGVVSSYRKSRSIYVILSG
jgi:hypothetical protein